MRSFIFLQHCEFSALVSKLWSNDNSHLCIKVQLSLLFRLGGNGPVSRIEYKLVIEG